jgi:carboxypeptidase PM20D1
MKLVLGNLWCFGPVLVKVLPKLSAQAGGLIGTTVAFNDVVSSEKGLLCTAKVVLRSVDEEDVKKDIANLTKVAEKYGIKTEAGDRWEIHAPADPTLPPFEILSRCVHEIYPDAPVIPYILPAGTDARVLTDVCPCVLRFAPLRLTAQQLASVHSEDENVDITAIGSAVVFYRRVLETYTLDWEDIE